LGSGNLDSAPIDARRQIHLAAAVCDNRFQAFRKRLGVVCLVVAHRSVIASVEDAAVHRTIAHQKPAADQHKG